MREEVEKLQHDNNNNTIIILRIQHDTQHDEKRYGHPLSC